MLSKELVFGAQFYEADPMGVVWHGRYVKYFERVRTALFEDLGFGYQPMCDSGWMWPVVELRVKYLRPIKPAQRVRVRCELVEWEHRIVIDYGIRDADGGELLTKGRTVQVAVNSRDGQMSFETPAVLAERIRRAL